MLKQIKNLFMSITQFQEAKKMHYLRKIKTGIQMKKKKKV